MKISLNLTKREAEAVMRAELSLGHGIRQSNTLARAQFRIHQAIIDATRDANAGAESAP